MRLITSTLVSILASALAVAAHNIQLHAHSRECFHETLHKDDRMTVTFQVGDREFGGAGNLDIDFWVSPSSPTARSGGERGAEHCLLFFAMEAHRNNGG